MDRETLNILALYTERTQELGIKRPTLPFPILAMDGKPYVSHHREGEMTFPSRIDDYASRLGHLGGFWSDAGVLEYIEPDGSYIIARDVTANREALKRAGYRSHAFNENLFTNGRSPAGPYQEMFIRIMSTPQDQHERLKMAIENSDLAKMTSALSLGAELRKATEYNSNIPLISLTFQSSHPDSTEILKILLEMGENPLASITSRAVSFPFLAYSEHDPEHPKKMALVRNWLISNQSRDFQSVRVALALLDHVERTTSTDPALGVRLLGGLGKAWQFARQNTLKVGQLGIPTNIPVLFAPLLDPKQSAKFQQVLEKYDFEKLATIRDLVTEFSDQVVLPLFLLDYYEQLGESINDEQLASLGKVSSIIPTEEVFDVLFGSRSLDKIIGLNEAWHDHRVVFPDSLKPLAGTGEWHPLSCNKIIPCESNPRIVIHTLTSDCELETEGLKLDHCVGRGGYTSACLTADCHIFSVRTVDGTFLSTIEAIWDGKEFTIMQNYAEHNEEPSAEAIEAGLWLKQQFDSGAIKANDDLGETDSSRLRKGRPQLIYKIGYELSSDNVNAAFREFCDNRLRRGREYDPSTGKFTAVSRRNALISGTALINGDGVSYRDMSVSDWYQHSGLRERLWKRSPLREVYDEIRLQQEFAKEYLAKSQNPYQPNDLSGAGNSQIENDFGVSVTSLDEVGIREGNLTPFCPPNRISLNSFGSIAIHHARRENTLILLNIFSRSAISLLKRAPLFGAAITLIVATNHVIQKAKTGDFKRSIAEGVSGVAEALGNIIGLGWGDVAREITRSALKAFGGPVYEAEKSGLRDLSEKIPRIIGKARRSNTSLSHQIQWSTETFGPKA